MKYIEQTVINLSPKAAIIHMLECYPKKNLMIMISDELFRKFEELSDVRRVISSEFERRNAGNHVVYDFYENSQVETSEYYGKAVFVRICGVWMMSSFDSDTFEYNRPSEQEADLIISLK